MPTVRRAHLLMVFATAFAMVGCAAMRRHEARDTGDLLVSAGFTTKPADTPERAQELHAMPPLKLVSQSKDGHVVYRYADPYSCDPRSRWLKAQAADGWPSADPRGRPPETADTPARCAEGSAHPYAHRATKYAQHREFPRVCRLFVLSRVRQCSGTVVADGEAS